MRTRILSTLLPLAAGLPAVAQITITAADNVPAVGDTFVYNKAAYAAPPAGGADVFFDYSGLVATGSTAFHWFAPGVYSGAGAFPDAHLAATNDLDTFLYELTSAGLERVAEHKHLVVLGQQVDLDIAHDNSALDLKLPLANNDTWSDPLAGTVTADGETGTRNGLIQGLADGYGHIQLPGGGEPVPVLRVRSSVQETIQIPIAGNMTDVVHKRVQHDYFAPWLKMPILSVYSDSLISFITLANNGIRWLGSEPVGLMENAVAEQGFALHPNPAQDVVTVTFAGAPGPGARIEVLDALGRVLRSERVGAAITRHTFSLASEVPGCYFVRLTGAQGTTGTQRLIKR